jgi:hypothetical protein
MPRPVDQGFVTPQQQMIPRPNLFQTLNTGNQSAQGTPTTPNATPNKENIQKGNRELLQENHCLEAHVKELNNELMRTYHNRDVKSDFLDDAHT